jgi:hypothetical protein
MSLFRRHAAVGGIKTGLAQPNVAATFGHLEPLVEFWRKTGPSCAEPRVDTARFPFLGTLADPVGGEAPGNSNIV